MRRVVLLLGGIALFGLAAGACATLGSTTGGDTGLPSARVGPFRALEKSEVLTAPFVFQSLTMQTGEPSVLAVDPSDPSRASVYLYAVASANGDAGAASPFIVRTRADDGRGFYGTASDLHDPPHVPAVVLTASLPWEGAGVSGPSALRVGLEYYLYYAAAGGIGLARSADGLEFAKNPVPVLTPDPAAAWETTTPSAPSVAQLPDGTFDMMYSAGDSIGEASSFDGITFTRVDADPKTPALDPVFSPLRVAKDAVAAADGSVAPFDTGQVSDPCVLPVVDPAGRLVVRVLYTGYDGPPGDATRSSAIGFAARFGKEGPLVRQALPVLSIAMHEAAPTYFAWRGGELLYVQAAASSLFGSSTEDIAAAIAPATVMLDASPGFAAAP